MQAKSNLLFLDSIHVFYPNLFSFAWPEPMHLKRDSGESGLFGVGRFFKPFCMIPEYRLCYESWGMLT